VAAICTPNKNGAGHLRWVMALGDRDLPDVCSGGWMRIVGHRKPIRHKSEDWFSLRLDLKMRADVAWLKRWLREGLDQTGKWITTGSRALSLERVAGGQTGPRTGDFNPASSIESVCAFTKALPEGEKNIPRMNWFAPWICCCACNQRW